MSDIGEVLGICMWKDETTNEKCDKIRIDNSNNLWLKREDAPLLYDTLFKKYNDALKVSHTYCPEHAEAARKKYGLD